MPHATKDAPARPFDVPDAIHRAARCRALRERAGLNLESFAAVVGVTVRSVNRWESFDGRGSTPDGVLETLETILDKQADLVADAVDTAGRLCRARLGSDTGGGPRVSETVSETCAAGWAQCIAPEGGDALNQAVYAGSVQGGDPAENRALPKPISMPGGGGGGGGDALDAMTVTLPYYSSQHAFDLCHPNERFHFGVANANARAIAQELERLGFIVDWRYAERDNISDFEIRTF